MDTSKDRVFIEETFTKAMAHSLGVCLPSETIKETFIAYALSRLQLTNSGVGKGGRKLDEQYVYDCIPVFMDWLYAHSSEDEVYVKRHMPGTATSKLLEKSNG
tara:strand:+ start:58 stop:366 length:309 start_codon:yes stop_codon:yes gene_type:complete